MGSHPDTFPAGGAWFADDGAEKDVVLFTRVRLARNLANFAFPSASRQDDAERVQALVFDVFSRMENPERYQCVPLGQVEDHMRQLLAERGVIPERDCSQRNINLVGQDTARKFDCVPGLVVRSDGRLSCLVNAQDHVRISAFAAGLDPGEAWRLCREVDGAMQESLQFAASYDFGFLTAGLKDAGSGMKPSVWVFLPALMNLGRMKEITEQMSARSCALVPSLGGGAAPLGALGGCYQLSSALAFSGSEEDQLTEFSAAVGLLCSAERKARAELLGKRPTLVMHIVSRMLALARSSRFLECSEAVEIASALHLGLSCGLLDGISYPELHALLLRARNGHVDFLRRRGNFMLEDDVKDDVGLVIPRLRALLVQEAVENVRICV